MNKPKKLEEIERDILKEYWGKWERGELTLPAHEEINRRLIAVAEFLQREGASRAYRLAFLIPEAFYIDKSPDEAVRELKRLAGT